MFGMAIASSSPAVGARCAHARAGVGVVATQNLTDPALGTHMLARLAQGESARAAVDKTLSATAFADYRQIIAIGVAGAPIVHTGAKALGIAAQAIDTDAAAAGNLLASPQVPQHMVDAYRDAPGTFFERLLAALQTGLAAGGEAGAVHSAALLVVRDLPWPLVDLRIDWTDADPVAALYELWQRYAPQLEDYVARALDPARAASFAVPGDP